MIHGREGLQGCEGVKVTRVLRSRGCEGSKGYEYTRVSKRDRGFFE